MQQAVAATGVKFVLQAEQRGTGHALQVLKAFFAMSGTALPENLLVLSGDVPLIREETLSAVREMHLREHAAMTILTAEPPDPHQLWAGDARAPRRTEVLAIVEQKALTAEQRTAAEINSGIYCFQTKALFARLDSLSTDNAHGEFYLTDVAAMLVADGERVVAVKAGSADEVLGANTIAEMMQLDAAVRAQTARRLMGEGVTIFKPEDMRDRRRGDGGGGHGDRALRAVAGATQDRQRVSGAGRIRSCRIRCWAMACWCATDASSTMRRSAMARCWGPYAHSRGRRA